MLERDLPVSSGDIVMMMLEPAGYRTLAYGRESAAFYTERP
jgi:hypothetical protein